MDEAFIVVSIVSGLFTLAGIMLINHNWFKKERFKLEVHNVKAENALRMKKLARELGVDTKPTPQGSGLDVNNIIGLLGNPKVRELIDTFTGQPSAAAPDDYEEPQEKGVLDSMIDGFVQSEAGQKVIGQVLQGGVKSVAQGQQTDQSSQV